jgi:hypothetical protein
VGDNPTSAGNQQESLSSEEQRRWFLAGVIEGEGSVYVGIKAHPTVPLGFFVQPGFSITQHRIRRSLLEMAREEFGAGTIYPKPGNESVLVYSIHSRPVLSAVVAPFLGGTGGFPPVGTTSNASGTSWGCSHREPTGSLRDLRRSLSSRMR